MPRRLLRVLIFVLCVSALCAAGRTKRPTSRELLGKTILGKDTALKEVQDFCEARIPKMPEVTNLKDWERTAEQLRRDVLANVVFRGEAGRLARRQDRRSSGSTTIEGGPGYRIKKLRYEALPGLWIPALLYEPEKLAGKVPVVPERQRPRPQRQGGRLQADPLHQPGQARHARAERRVARHGPAQRRRATRTACMNQLDLCGTSGLAPFYLSHEARPRRAAGPRARRPEARAPSPACPAAAGRRSSSARSTRASRWPTRSPATPASARASAALHGPGRLGADARATWPRWPTTRT